MHPSHRKWTRRALLRRTAAGAALAPFLPLLEADSEAQDLPKRLFFMIHGHGWPLYNTLPPDSDATLAQPFNTVLKPLEAYKKSMVVLEGLNNMAYAIPGGDIFEHARGWTSMLTGYQTFGRYQPGGISIDQAIAGKISVGLKYKSLQLAAALDDSACWAAAANQSIKPQPNPYQAFDGLFKGLAPGTGATDATALAKARAKKQSVIDFVKTEVTTLRGQIGAADRMKMDTHLSALQEIEASLSTLTPPATPKCAAPTVPAGLPVSAGGGNGNPTLSNVVFETMLDIASAAFACDLTRVASVQFGDIGGDPAPPQLGLTGGGHDASHAAAGEKGGKGYVTTRLNYFAQAFADRVVGKLAGNPEGTGTMLDRSVCIWTSQFSDGGHNPNGLLYTLVGGQGLGLKGGRYVKLGTGAATQPGLPAGSPAVGGTVCNQDFYVSLANLFGVAMTTFGKPDLCKGPMSGFLG